MILQERQSARLMTENMRLVSKRNAAGIESVCKDLCFGEQAKPKRCMEYKNSYAITILVSQAISKALEVFKMDNQSTYTNGIAPNILFYTEV